MVLFFWGLTLRLNFKKNRKHFEHFAKSTKFCCASFFEIPKKPDGELLPLITLNLSLCERHSSEDFSLTNNGILTDFPHTPWPDGREIGKKHMKVLGRNWLVSQCAWVTESSELLGVDKSEIKTRDEQCECEMSFSSSCPYPQPFAKDSYSSSFFCVIGKSCCVQKGESL